MRNGSIDQIFEAPISKLTTEGAIAKYMTLYNSLEQHQHTLTMDRANELFIALKYLSAADECFYICRVCKELTSTNRHRYQHELHNIVKISDICHGGKKFKNLEEIEYQIKNQFGQLGR